MAQRKPNSLPPGVQNHHGTLRIWFQYDGQRCYEPMNMAPTPANIKAAGKVRADIMDRIRLGRFDYAEFFPDSPRAAHLGRLSFGAFAAIWLQGQQPGLAYSTWEGYRKILDRYWLPRIGGQALAELTGSDLLAALADCAFPSAKTRNNAVSVLRLVFGAAHLDGRIAVDPTARLKSVKVQREPPDPFTPAETARILEGLRARHHEQHWNYFQFAFYTGMRTSELIALRWEDIDWTAATATVRRAKVRHQIKATTKTATVRTVELGRLALEALHRQRAHTQLQGGAIFHNPNTGVPYLDDRPMREHVWTPTLKRLGLRHRPAYNTRHTYATLLLMAGANPAWAANQLGHGIQMFLTVYARWLNAADGGRERAKVEALLGEGAANPPAERSK